MGARDHHFLSLIVERLWSARGLLHQHGLVVTENVLIGPTAYLSLPGSRSSRRTDENMDSNQFENFWGGSP